jgi:DNA-binding beta-propeller fold protein YncE
MFPNYENTVSVIDLSTFTEVRRIAVAINLHRIRADRRGDLWVSSRGDYYGTPSRLYRIDAATGRCADTIPLAVSNFYLHGDSLYLYSTAWSYVTMSNEVTYGIIHTATREVVTRNFITDSATLPLQTPYGLLVHPLTGDIYLTDARNYVSPGYLHCLDANGRLQWSVRTGDIPAHFAPLPDNNE